MGGEQHAALSICGDAPQQLRQLIPGYRIQTAGGLIQDQQPCVVAQSQGDHVLHLHSAGELIHPLALINGEKLQIMAVFFLVPVLVKPPDHVGKGGDCFLGVEVDAPQHHPDILLDEFLAPGKAPAKDLHLTGIRMHQAQNGLNGSALAGAVAADEAHHRPLGHGKGHILQCKSRVRLAQAPDLHDVHSSSTSASVSSNTRRIMGLSLSVVCRAMPFFRSASSTS